MNRRDFIKAAGGLIATALLPSCTEARDKESLLKNEDRPGFYIRFYKPFRP
ncbi:MAG: twin-arginine translocation signal domain-containing protein, partial [Thermodesulfovibrionales bacterium]